MIHWLTVHGQVSRMALLFQQDRIVKIPQGYRITGLNKLFSAAAFRLGHTLLSSNLPRRDNLGKPILQGDILLKNTFFNPPEFRNSGGPESIFKEASVQMQQDMDHKVIHDVRNFLFGTPGAGGRDLLKVLSLSFCVLPFMKNQ